jgi:hypothetical protein
MRTSAPLGALVALVVAGILGLTDVTVTNALATLVIYAAALVVLGLFARVVVHDMLLAEADATVRGDARPCSHCGAVTPLMAFCVNCGIALRSTPKRVR